MLLNWDAFGEKIQGVTHTINKTPCQDDFNIILEENYVVVSVADGHGSQACPYSDQGAQVAVETVNFYFANLFSGLKPDEAYSCIQKNIDTQLPKQIEKVWKEKIIEIHKRNNKEEVDEENLFALYGTTLLTVAITENLIFALQIGDGDILSVYDSGESAWLIDPPRHLGIETDSLSAKESWKYMKCKLSPVDKNNQEPILFLISTDGYSNSFVSKEEFQKIGFDYLEILKKHGIDYIKNNLLNWLNSASESGSGDDITLVLLFNKQVVRQ